MVSAEGHSMTPPRVYNGRNVFNQEFIHDRNAECIAEELDVMPSPINFTDSAAEKVAQLIEEEGNPDLKLRVFVQGGGCSGFQYGFTFDEIVNEDDTTMEKNGVSC
jgi:hypothetical protein